MRPEKEKKRAEALRENLLKRKAQKKDGVAKEKEKACDCHSDRGE
jgi:hypothetical protein